MRGTCMHKYEIEGKRSLKGTVKASGNKNAALPCLAAALLSEEPVVLSNVPKIEDTQVMIQEYRYQPLFYLHCLLPRSKFLINPYQLPEILLPLQQENYFPL